MLQTQESIALGQRIRTARKARGYTQMSLGHKMGWYTAHGMAQTESGERALTLVEAVRLAEILEVDLGYLTGRQATFRVDTSVLPGVRFARYLLDQAIDDIQLQAKGA